MREPARAAEAGAAGRWTALGQRMSRPVVLVGIMGVGKTTVGRRLAEALRWQFVDADDEIERAAGLTVAEIFARHGEPEFRRGEREVIARLLREDRHVVATGGGAFVDPLTRARIRERAVSIWLRAPLDVLMARVARRDDRPLLRTADPRATLEALLASRTPAYEEADLSVDSTAAPHASTVATILAALEDHTAR